MKKICINLLILFILAGISIVSAEPYDEIIEYDSSTTYALSVSSGYAQSITAGQGFATVKIPTIENWKHISTIELIETGTNFFQKNSDSGTFYFEAGGVTYGSGTWTATSQAGSSVNDRFTFYFSSWDIGAATGDKEMNVVITSGTPVTTVGGTYDVVNTYQLAPIFTWQVQHWSPDILLYQTTFQTEYKAHLLVEETEIAGEGGYDVTELTYERTVSGTAYPSSIDVRTSDGNYVYINNYYATSGTSYTFIDHYPTEISIRFGYPVVEYYWNRTITGDNPLLDIVELGPPTATPTATPTPVPELCGYWSLAVNTSNIQRNDYVTGTLTEADPDNKHKQIDWYLVLPSGQEVIQEHFVYDEGFFGLGAGWVNVNPYTGVATASSEAAATEVSFDYPTIGKQWMRVKIYEDKSLVPAAYHDYNLFCTLDQVVYVADTTQGTGQFAVNVYESGTNALVSGVTVHLFDYATGEWYNKSASTGGTIFFNVVPGHEHRILVDETYWNTYDEDYTIPDPVPSQPYKIYLIRPLPEVVGGSYARFYIKDGSTYQAIYGASIALSDGQIKATLPSGFAEFNVTDGTPYYYTVSRTGYEGQTGTFNISVDTVLPTVFLYPKAVVTTPTTIPYWTQTPTPLPTYANGTIIPGYTYAPTVTATLNVIERDQKLTESTDIWYRFAPFLSQLIFIVVVVGLLGLMTKSLGGGGSGGRRRRY